MRTPHHGHALVASDARDLLRALPIEQHAIRSRRVLRAAGARLVHIAMDAGQTLAPHSAATPLLLQTLQGEAVVVADDERIAVCDGAVLHLGAGVTHAVEAIAPTHLLVTFLEAAGRSRAAPDRGGSAPTDDDPAATEPPSTRPVDSLFDRIARGTEPALPSEQTAVGADTDDTAVDASTCACGIVELPELPELDVRSIPHAIRHGAVFGALDAVRPGGGLVLIAHHDPLPLLAQIRQRSGDRFVVRYLERGPEAWRLQFVEPSAEPSAERGPVGDAAAAAAVGSATRS